DGGEPRADRSAAEHPRERRAGPGGTAVRAADVRAFVGELKGLGFAVRAEIEPRRSGPIVVSGVLAEQLAKELGAGAAPGAVVVASNADLPHAAAPVRILAAAP